MKAVKWWNTNQLGVSPLSSYYIELAIMRGFQQKNQWGTYTELISDAVALGFEAIRDATSWGDLDSWVASAPKVERGDLTQDQLGIIDLVATSARGAVNHEINGNSDSALEIWAYIFGPKFSND